MQSSLPEDDALAAASAPATTALTTSSAPAVTGKTPAEYYDGLTLLPALVAIILAITLRQVVPAMVIGIMVAAFMMQPFKPADSQFAAAPGSASGYVVQSVRLGVEGYIVGAYTLHEDGPKRVMVVLFTLFIGGMIGVIQVSGGTRAVVDSMARFASNARRGQLTAWFAGLLIFFDDYANCLIIGPTMRPVFDRLRISRQKLAYIIDSTASCVASIMISTWLATEINMIDLGLSEAAKTGLPEFLHGATGFSIFWASIPYRYYAVLTIVLVFLIAVTRRDFGPMLRAERAALAAPPDGARAASDGAQPRGRAWYAIVPVVVIVFGMLGLLLATGWEAGTQSYKQMAAQSAGAETTSATGIGGNARFLIEVLGNGNTYLSILYAGLAALVVGIAINLLTRAATVKRTFDGMMSGMTHVFPALIVLSLAWALSGATGQSELGLGLVAKKYVSQVLAPQWLPLVTFLSAALVSFATGTSWGTIIILAPLATQLGASVAAGMPESAAGEAQEIFLATVGAVLAGAVFGDHCSPLNDSTVMAALVSECSLESHVWTQFPYAIVTMLTTVFVGDVLVRALQLSPWIGLLGGTFVLLVVLLVFGRRAEAEVRGPNLQSEI